MDVRTGVGTPHSNKATPTEKIIIQCAKVIYLFLLKGIFRVFVYVYKTTWRIELVKKKISSIQSCRYFSSCICSLHEVKEANLFPGT